MYSKKLIYTGVTVPALVFLQQAAEYQKRRKNEKLHEEQRRSELLAAAPVNITPANGRAFPWTNYKGGVDAFEEDYAMKPVSITGFFDNEKEIQVAKNKNGEKGV